MKWLTVVVLLFGAGAWLRADDVGGNTAEAVEQQVAALVARPEVTIVHFWAPWCSNCKREMRPDGWAKFVRENPGVRVVFINVWHGGLDGTRELAAADLGEQANFVAFMHPTASRKAGEKLEKFMELPVGWVPTTWVFREGRQRYALNYGEVRFEMLQQMVEDAARKW